ncbi:MAG: hypothetical protein P1P69_06145 [Methanosarcinaceae archaeon]|nr:hypothetical protein [Methanosarcinaceae archaeon]
MTCSHKSCGSVDKIWLPHEFHVGSKGLKSHVYCINCGAVKNISTDRLKKTSYYINSLSKVDRRIIKLTQVQMRLIVKKLEGIKDFDDGYYMTRHAQEKTFIKVVKNYCNVSEEYIASILKN